MESSRVPEQHEERREEVVLRQKPPTGRKMPPPLRQMNFVFPDGVKETDICDPPAAGSRGERPAAERSGRRVAPLAAPEDSLASIPFIGEFGSSLVSGPAPGWAVQGVPHGREGTVGGISPKVGAPGLGLDTAGRVRWESGLLCVGVWVQRGLLAFLGSGAPSVGFPVLSCPTPCCNLPPLSHRRAHEPQHRPEGQARPCLLRCLQCHELCPCRCHQPLLAHLRLRPEPALLAGLQ